MLRARWLGLSEGLIVESSHCRHLSIRFESKRRAGAKLWANSSRETGCLFVIQRGVTAGLSGPRQTCSQKFSARSAKLFTVGCGESWRRLSSPPMNNFGPTIRVDRSGLTLGKGPTDPPTLKGEWRLDKRLLLFGSGSAAAFVSVPAIDKLVARFIEFWILGTLLDGARFASSRSKGEQICA